MNKGNIDIEPIDSVKQMINGDIKKCENFFAGDIDIEKGRELHLELISKYTDYILGFGKSLYNYDPTMGFVYPDHICEDYLVHNLKVMLNRLISYKNFGYKNSEIYKHRYAENKVLNVTFEEVKQKVEEMTALSDAETQETLAKVDEIKSIIESPDTKKVKWRKLNPILKWLSDKSVDVGTAIMPLLYKIVL